MVVAHSLPFFLPQGHQKQLDRIDHSGFAFFKPLILSAYLRVSLGVPGVTVNPREHATQLMCVETLLAEIERFIVVVLKLSGANGTTGKANMESAAFTLLKPGRDGFLAEDYGISELDSEGAVNLVSRWIRAYVGNTEQDDGSFDDDDFPREGLFLPFQLQTHIERRFQNGDGFYKWDFTMSEERREKCSLGMHGLELTHAFGHSVRKATLPLLCGQGQVT